MTGWDSLVDFPTRGDAYLDKVFTNRPDLFAKSIPYFVSIKTDHTAVIVPAGTKLKPIETFALGIVDDTVKKDCT